jgi:hypothetical protein
MKNFLCLLNILPAIVFAQSNADDYFPLSVGNVWTYDYAARQDEQLADVIEKDSGVAIYKIVSKTVSSDSTLWEFMEVRNIRRSVNYFFPGHRDTTYWIQDSTLFTLIEYLSGNHRILRNDIYSYGNWRTVLPFWSTFSDSSSFYRYHPGVVLDTFTVRVQNTNGAPHERFTIRYERHVGLRAVSYQTLDDVGWSYTTSHTLRETFISSMKRDRQIGSLDQYVLRQNYPNPFNPVTSISFTIPTKSEVVVRIYDVLGRTVGTILDEQLNMGDYSVNWDATNLSSGTYYCVLRANGIAKSLKIVLQK